MTLLTLDDVHQGRQTIDPTQVGLLVCDIDGTLADLSHRRHHLQKPKNYPAFKRGVLADLPIGPVIRLVQALHQAGSTVVLASGREGDHRGKADTQQWLARHQVPYHALYMRQAKDYRADDIIKDEIRQQIEADYGPIDLVLDDRNRVVAMWRAAGIPCIQVAEGDF